MFEIIRYNNWETKMLCCSADWQLENVEVCIVKLQIQLDAYSKHLASLFGALLTTISLNTIFDFQVSYFLLIGFLGFWHGVLAANVPCFGRDLGGARNIVLIQGFEAFGNGLGGFFAPPITSKLPLFSVY